MGAGGGYKMGGGGACEVLPLQQVLAMLKGGGTTSFGVIFTQLLELLAILTAGGGGGHKILPLFKRRRGAKMFYPVLRAGAKSFGPTIFPFCSPSLPVINDRSLKLISSSCTRCIANISVFSKVDAP